MSLYLLFTFRQSKENIVYRKKLKWRPCKDIEELEDLLNCDVLAFVGRVLELKDKSTGATIIVGITGTEELPIDSGSILKQELKMSLSIALNSKQLENLSKESLKLKTNYAVKGIDLFINSQDLNLIWLQKMLCKKEDMSKIPEFADNKVVYLGRIYEQVNEKELRAFIYNKVFELNIRNQERYYGSQEIRTLDLKSCEYRKIH